MENPAFAVSSLSIILNNLVLCSTVSCATHPKKAQKAIISLRIEGDFLAKAWSDDIGDTLDYDLLAQKIGAAPALTCDYESLQKKIGQIVYENYPKFGTLKGKLHFACCKALEKPHCFSMVSSLQTH